jgi:hypothetical protein
MAALDYLRSGYRLLALNGKRPNMRYHLEWSWDNCIWGEPTGHEQDVADIFDHPSTTGIAILIPENVLVADIDTEEAAALFKDLAGDPKDTAIGRTINGIHVWYVAPGEAASRWLGGRTLLFKGHGGYVAVEPSKHFAEDGTEDGEYRWLTPPEEGFDFLPDGIATMLKVQDVAAEMLPKPEYDMTRTVMDGWKWWQEYDLGGLERAIETAAQGNQNNVIHWAACVARDGGVPYEVSMDRLLKAALRGMHPRSRAVATIRGAYKVRRG